LNEAQLLAWLRRSVDPTGRWIGDDAAFLPAGDGWALSVDHQIAGTHYPVDLDPATVGRRLVAVNLSDLAATGARPAYALLALAAPAGYDAQRLLAAVDAQLREVGARLVGGDLARAQPCVASLTVVGRRYPRGRWLRRDAAQPGDVLWLGGTVGESVAGRLWIERGALPRKSATGRQPRFEWPPALELELRSRRLLAPARRAILRHLAPTPQLGLSRWLALRPRAAAIDISDGLALDLHRLCRASRLGAEIDAARLPLPRSFDRLASALRQSPLELALGGGEDYVLLFALPEGQLPPPRWRSTAIGRCVRQESVVLIRDGERIPLTASGWDHFVEA
jgi:thiamine-monophosphate kinase